MPRYTRPNKEGNKGEKEIVMKGYDNPGYLQMLIVFNILAIFFLIAAVRWPRISRLLFFLLFAWACWLNWTTVLRSPDDYLQYGELSFSSRYTAFIQGWFSQHITLVVGTIATCQGLIALSLCWKGVIYKIGCAGAVVFLLAIAPLGIGSGFPCTLVFAIALFVLFRKGNEKLWVDKKLLKIS